MIASWVSEEIPKPQRPLGIPIKRSRGANDRLGIVLDRLGGLSDGEYSYRLGRLQQVHRLHAESHGGG